MRFPRLTMQQCSHIFFTADLTFIALALALAFTPTSADLTAYPLQYHPWPPWSLRGKLSIFQIAKTLKYESGCLFSRAIEALGGAEVEVAAELHLARTRQSLLPAPTHYVRSFEGFRGKRGDHSLTHHTHERRDPTTLPQTIMKKSKVRLGGRPSTRTEQARQGLPPSGWTRR